MNILLMYEPSEVHLRRLKKSAESASFSVAFDEPSAAGLIENAEVVMGNRYFLQSLPFARKLKWMQSNSMGVDIILEGGSTKLKNILLTSCRGVYDDEISDHAIALILALCRKLHIARDMQNRKKWSREPLQSLPGKQALILGWGGVGRGIARRLAVFGVTVRGVRRTQAGGPERDETGCMIYGPDTWREILPETDMLVLALPKTKATINLVSDEELTSLRRGALVINVGRGGTMNETALQRGLKKGRVSGAALDVFASEPLPPDNWIWNEQKVLMTPHWSRSIESPPYRWEALFEENLRRFASGEPLLNVVNKETGY